MRYAIILTFLATVTLCSPMLSAAEEWPEASGPHSDGRASATVPLLPDFSRAKPLWASEREIAPGRVDDGRRAAPDKSSGTPHSGGFASPIIADGRVYMVTYRPSGSVYDKTALQRAGVSAEQAAAQSEGDAVLLRGTDRWLVGASDVITAVDTRTGRTLWERVIADPSGLNFNMFNKGGGGITPAAADGYVYVAGIGGAVYCLKGEDGEVVWRSDIGERAQQMAALRVEAEKSGHGIRFNRNMTTDVAVIDGVVVVSDQSKFKYMQPPEGKWKYVSYENGSGLMGLNAKTGKPLWHHPKVAGEYGISTWIAEDGKRYVIGDGVNGISLMNPRNGKVVWRSPLTVKAKWLPQASGNLLVMNDNDDKDKNGGLRGLRISLTGAELIWTLDAAMPGPVCRPMVVDNHVYYVANNGALICVDGATGAKRASIDGAGLGTSVEHDNAFLLFWQDRLVSFTNRDLRAMRSFTIDPENFRQIGGDWVMKPEATVGYIRSVIPAFANGLCVVRTERNLVAFSLAGR